MPDASISCKAFGLREGFYGWPRADFWRRKGKNSCTYPLTAPGYLLAHFFTEAEQVSVEIFDVEVLATPRPRFERANNIRSVRSQFSE